RYTGGDGTSAVRRRLRGKRKPTPASATVAAPVTTSATGRSGFGSMALPSSSCSGLPFASHQFQPRPTWRRLTQPRPSLRSYSGISHERAKPTAHTRAALYQRLTAPSSRLGSRNPSPLRGRGVGVRGRSGRTLSPLTPGPSPPRGEGGCGTALSLAGRLCRGE